MNIVLTLDNNYCQHAAVVIASVCYNNPQKHIFFIITDYISEHNIAILSKLVQSYNSTIIFRNINLDLTKNFPIGIHTANTYVTLATYYRLFMIDLLPSYIDKVLYLDCDLVVNGSLEELWNWEFKGITCIAAVEEQLSIGIKRTKALGYPQKYSYFNAGVLLVDVNKMREAYSYKKAINYIQQKKDIIQYHDQDVLNGLFYDKKEFLPLEFNVMDIYLYQRTKLPQRYINEEKSLLSPKIIHFSGPMKPWFKECKHPYKELYYFYLSNTEWRSYIPKSKFTKRQDKLIYLAKELTKKFLGLLRIKCYNFRKNLPSSRKLIPRKLSSISRN